MKKTNPKQTSLLHKDIPRMSEGYYSGDKPNPNLRTFVESHAEPYDPETDSYTIDRVLSVSVRSDVIGARVRANRHGGGTEAAGDRKPLWRDGCDLETASLVCSYVFSECVAR